MIHRPDIHFGMCAMGISDSGPLGMGCNFATISPSTKGVTGMPLSSMYSSKSLKEISGVEREVLRQSNEAVFQETVLAWAVERVEDGIRDGELSTNRRQETKVARKGFENPNKVDDGKKE